jgi:hypothetical protein
MIKPNKVTTNARVGKNKPRVTNSDEILSTIFDRISGGESVNTICSKPDMPSRASFFRWLKDDESLLARYNIAIETRAYLFAEEIIQIADEEPPRTAKGSMDSAFVAWQKTRIDARKWIVSRMLPKVYGDKIDLTSKGDVFDPVRAIIMAVQGTSLPVCSGAVADDEEED